MSFNKLYGDQAIDWCCSSCHWVAGHQPQNDGPYLLGKKKPHDSKWSFIPPSVSKSQGLVCGWLCSGHHRMQRELRPSSCTLVGRIEHPHMHEE